jgi:hypothetical protein
MQKEDNQIAHGPILQDREILGHAHESIIRHAQGKTTGVSATTNVHDSDLLWVFSSSTAFTPARSYDRFGAYAVLDHGGDHAAAAAAALAARGYGRRPDPLEVSGARPVSIDVAPVTLGDTIAIFRRWLALDDPAAVYAVAATLAANRAVGDPVWLLIVCAPSSGKTEILSAATGLPFVVSPRKSPKRRCYPARRNGNG